MDKLRRVLSGDEPTPEEESSIITQVKFLIGVISLNIMLMFEMERLSPLFWSSPRETPPDHMAATAV